MTIPGVVHPGWQGRRGFPRWLWVQDFGSLLLPCYLHLQKWAWLPSHLHAGHWLPAKLPEHAKGKRHKRKLLNTDGNICRNIWISEESVWKPGRRENNPLPLGWGSCPSWVPYGLSIACKWGGFWWQGWQMSSSSPLSVHTPHCLIPRMPAGNNQRNICICFSP